MQMASFDKVKLIWQFYLLEMFAFVENRTKVAKVCEIALSKLVWRHHSPESLSIRTTACNTQSVKKR